MSDHVFGQSDVSRLLFGRHPEPMADLEPWATPDGLIVAKVYDEYPGLAGQPRVALLDRLGRLHHYDESQVSRP